MISVLYVDDEPLLLDVGKVFLESSREITVEKALSAREGLELLSRTSYDAVISDYQMPEMDGIGFLKEVRSRFDRIPFILFTGRGREEVVIEAINHGADFYLQKGGDPKSQFAELSDKIKKAVEHRRALDALKNSEQRLSDIINFLPDATFAIDTRGNVIAWNKAIEDLTATPGGMMIGRGDYEYALPFYGERRPLLADLVFKTDEEIQKYNYRIIKREGSVLITETSAAHPRGKPKIFFCKASPLFDKNGTITGAIESVRDITEQKHAEMELRAAYEQITATEAVLRQQYNTLKENQEEIQAASAELLVKEQFLFQDYEELRRKEKALQETEDGFQVVLDKSPCAIYVESENRFRYLNTPTLQLFGAGDSHQLIGREIGDWVHTGYHEPAGADSREGTEFRNHAPVTRQRYRRMDGSLVEVDETRVPFRFGGREATLVFLRDISW